MAQRGVVKFSMVIFKVTSWLTLAVFAVAGVTNAVSVLRGVSTPELGDIPKWMAPIVLLLVWSTGVLLFALTRLIVAAVECLAEIRDNTTRA